jgi:hypothetical protein
MINSTDLQEVEISLPGQWTRKDSGDVYTFTNEKMELRDERLFKQLDVLHDGQTKTYRYALAIEDDYCSVVVDDQQFVILSLTKREDGSASMEWSSQVGLVIEFSHAPQARH